MSIRNNGKPLWWLRPIVDGVIDESRAELFAGTLAEVVIEANWRFVITGLVHTARECDS